MTYAPNSYTGNGSTVLFPFSFPYIDRAHVKVAVNGVLTTAFTFANATTIQLNSAPSVGVPILIYRDTPSDAAEATIFAGSAIRASDLNANTTQLLYVAEETEFGTETANNTANAAASAAANAVSSAATANITAGNALSAANGAVSTANSALSTANAANSTAQSANNTAINAESAAVSALANSNAALAAVAAAVSYVPVADLTALGLLIPADGDFFELEDSTGADTDPSITGVPPGLVGDPDLTFRLRYDNPPGEFVFLGYFANNPEARYAEIATEAAAAAAQADADQALLNAAAAQTTANGALQRSGGTMTGNIDFNVSQVFPVGGIQFASTDQRGVVRLTDSVTSASITTAATPNSVKAANDNANTRASKSGDTFTGPVSFPDGSASLPSIRFSSATTTGFWRGTGADGNVNLSIAGNNRFAFTNANGLIILGEASNSTTFMRLDRPAGPGTAAQYEVRAGGGGNLLFQDSLNGGATLFVLGRNAGSSPGELSSFNAGVGLAQPMFGARAFVKYNGTANSVLYAKRVSGVTKNSTGDYTVAFTDVKGTANYCAVTAGQVSHGSAVRTFIGPSVNTDQTTTSMRFNVSSDTGGVVDSNQTHIAFFDD